MNSPCKKSDCSMSPVEAVSTAIGNLSLLTISSNELSRTPKNEVQIVKQVLSSDVNCNEIYANNCSLNTRSETRMAIPEDFNPTLDCGLSRVISTSVVPMDIRLALRDSIHDNVNNDCMIRQNDQSNAQQNSPRMLHSNSLDCVITLYESESEDSDFSLVSDEYSSDDNSELEFRESFRAQKLSSSSDESLHSDGESVESSEDLSSDSDEDSNGSAGDSSSDSDEDSSDLDEEPCDDSEPSDDEPDEDSAATSDDDKPDSTDDEDSGEDGGSANDEGSSDHDDEDESSDDDKSIDLDDSSDSHSESSDSE